ncbi:dynein axonemal intermediate chain 4, partial [Genypterus blacodes]|uniref:dynein axonemal intermediate chain 4 n=1 Tax=Genypterus blacodes TaxID=154954 RepID=UPI003F766023
FVFLLPRCPSSYRAHTLTHGLTHGVPQSRRLSRSVTGSTSRRSFHLGGGSRVSVSLTTRQATRVLDDSDNDITPRTLYQAEPGAPQPKASRLFLDETPAGTASDLTTTTGSFTAPIPRSFFGSSRISSQSTVESVNEEIEDKVYRRDVPIIPTAPYDAQGKRDNVKEKVTEETLDKLVDVFLSETDNISLLDIPSVCVSADDDGAEAIQERNNRVEMCKNRAGDEKYLERSMQTLNEVTKNKQVQSDSAVMVDESISATTWEIHDSFNGPEHHESPELAKITHPDASVDSSRGPERSMSASSSASAGSGAWSQKEMETFGNLNTEADLQQIMLSDKFQQRLAELERSILGNIFQSKMAAYRQLPILTDPDKVPEPGTNEQRDEDVMIPALDRLWAFSCELTRGRNVTCMACNKKDPDLLAVGYGGFDSGSHESGLICCWSPRSPTWPQHVFHCDSCVTSMDFSANIPSQLAVGMHDGSIAIYNINIQPDKTHVINSRACPNKHLHPVWQVKWTKQHLSLMEEKEEVLISVSADGRISKWFLNNNGFDCIDLMKLNREPHTKKVNHVKKHEGTVVNTVSQSVQIPALCLDFQPTSQQDSSIYLVGTWEGLIHKCSCSNNQQVLETYKKHYCPVNCIAWCPLNPDLFLSCSSDWTIQLWKQDRLTPLLGFTSTKTPVYSIRWSPKWATVFGAITEEQVEIWDLNSSILEPTIVLPSVPDVKMTSLHFSTETECVIIGDSDGEVTVYLLKNLSVGEGNQVDVLEGIIPAATSR